MKSKLLMNAKIKSTKFALLNFAKLVIIEPFSRKNLFFGNFYLRKLVPLRQLRNIEYIGFLIFFSYSQKNRKTKLKISLKCQQMKIKLPAARVDLFSDINTFKHNKTNNTDFNAAAIFIVIYFLIVILNELGSIFPLKIEKWKIQKTLCKIYLFSLSNQVRSWKQANGSPIS